MTDSIAAERQALLTRAAIVEAQRQAACSANDEPARQAAELELQSLWGRYEFLLQRQKTI